MAIVTGSKFSNAIRTTVRYFVILLVSLLVIFPLYWMLVTAVQAPEVTLRYPPVLYPIDPNLKGFHAIFFEKQMGKWLINSGFVAILTTAITTALSILGAYALSWF